MDSIYNSMSEKWKKTNYGLTKYPVSKQGSMLILICWGFSNNIFLILFKLLMKRLECDIDTDLDILL